MKRFLIAAALGLGLLGSAAEARPVDYNDPQQNGPYRADMPSVPVNQGGGYYNNGQYYQNNIPAPNNNNYQLQQYPYGYWPYDNGSNHPGTGNYQTDYNGYYNNGYNNGYYNNGYYNNGYYPTNNGYYPTNYNNSGNIIPAVLNGILNGQFR